MNSIKHFVSSTSLDWAEKEKSKGNSLAGFIIRHMEQENKLRDAQQEAIKVYLWLKCTARNNTIVDIIEQQYDNSEGTRLKTFIVNLANEIESGSLRRYARTATDQDIKKFLTEFIGSYDGIATWLFSLPMGAGKTFVMASMIYIDLYFNLTTNDKRFAKNFLIFAPSGLKNSVIPSLRSIEHFDPTWVLPKDITEQIRKHLKFIVLDINKNEKKSNRIENPNARKVQVCLNEQDPYGYIFVTNAEKVILDRIIEEQYKHTLFELTEDEKSKQANELRHLLGKIPSLTILMDEVHHNQKEEGKLRMVIDKHFTKNATSIIGFTGTPYFKRKVTIDNITLTLDQIPNTVYHYELKNGVRNFLKQPLIKSFTSNTETIVRASLEDFYNIYYKSIYKDGRIPKLAIYCADIEKLEEEVLPIVIEFYTQKGLDLDEILKYYGARTKSNTGKKYTLHKDAEVEFNKLDTQYSKKRIILLCQIGKEGWDCQSLSGVVLSGEGDSPKNMVLQTACRCLREVDDAKTEIGLIYLNEGNKNHLEKELQDTHRITIKEFEQGNKEPTGLKRIDRRDYLQLPPLLYKQFMVEYVCTTSDAQTINTDKLLEDLADNLTNKEQPFYNPQITTVRTGFELHDASDVTIGTLKLYSMRFSYSMFESEILKSAFGALSNVQLNKYSNHIRRIYNTITQFGNYIEGFDLVVILSTIHQAFIPVSEIIISEKIDNRSVAWLVSDINKNPLSDKAKLYPENKDFINKISEYDTARINPATLTVSEDAKIKQLEETKNLMSGNPELINTLNEQIHSMHRSKLPIKYKDKSFHYIPYDFTASSFEKDILEKIFQLEAFQNQQLEVYFNGDRFLSTFKIKIYKRISGGWKLIQDKYTPDFLVIKRTKKNTIIKTLIIETKGAHLAHDFSDIRIFMQSKFIEINPGLFDFLYLEDGHPFDYQVQQIHDKMAEYFK